LARSGCRPLRGNVKCSDLSPQVR
jgi:protein phosphatase PTC7